MFMWPSLIALIVFLILSVSLINMLFSDIVLIILNTILLWVVLLRSYHEVRHKKIIYPYFVALAITFFIFIVMGRTLETNYILWQVLFVTVLFIVAELIIMGLYFYKEYEVEKKFNKWVEKRKKKK